MNETLVCDNLMTVISHETFYIAAFAKLGLNSLHFWGNQVQNRIQFEAETSVKIVNYRKVGLFQRP